MGCKRHSASEAAALECSEEQAHPVWGLANQKLGQSLVTMQ